MRNPSNDIDRIVNAMGLNVEFSTGDDLFPAKRVKNDPKQVKIYEITNPMNPLTFEKKEAERKKEEKILKRRVDNFTNGVNIYKNFQYVDIDLMYPCPSNWNYFKKPNQEQLITLIGSIETMGILCPLVLVKEKLRDDYMVICGQSRLTALRNLYANTQDEKKYKFAPCYVLDFDEVDEYFIRAMILDTNLSYRGMDQTILMKAIIERYEILKRTKTYRSEMNIAEALAEEFLVSRSTVYNYLSLKNRIAAVLFAMDFTITEHRYIGREDDSGYFHYVIDVSKYYLTEGLL